MRYWWPSTTCSETGPSTRTWGPITSTSAGASSPPATPCVTCSASASGSRSRRNPGSVRRPDQRDFLERVAPSPGFAGCSPDFAGEGLGFGRWSNRWSVAARAGWPRATVRLRGRRDLLRFGHHLVEVGKRLLLAPLPGPANDAHSIHYEDRPIGHARVARHVFPAHVICVDHL